MGVNRGDRSVVLPGQRPTWHPRAKHKNHLPDSVDFASFHRLQRLESIEGIVGRRHAAAHHLRRYRPVRERCFDQPAYDGQWFRSIQSGTMVGL